MKESYTEGATRTARNLIEAVSDVNAKGGAILVFLHKSVDGDCIGSACGICQVLRSLGAESYVMMPEELPEKMSFLNVGDLLFHPLADTPEAKEFASGRTINGKPFSFAVAVDCAEGDRMGGCGEIFDSCKDHIIIDHHCSVLTRADNMWIVPEASSACELCFYVSCKIAELLGKERGEVIDTLSARCFMAGIVTDTGRFTYKNTHSETLIAAGDLMELGADVSSVCYNLFDRKEKGKFMLSAEARSKVEFYADGKFAFVAVPHDLFVKHSADSDGVDDVVSSMRDIDGVEVAIVLRELESGEIRANIRSQNDFDSAAFAENYGGGGHMRAAGFTVKGADIMSLAEDVKAKVLEIL